VRPLVLTTLALSYHVARNPNRMLRSPDALVICMNVVEVTLVLTPPKCEVLAKLKN
jgi:hypothetical protein